MLGLAAKVVEINDEELSQKIAPWVARYKYNEIIYLEKNNLETESKIQKVEEYIKEEPYSYQNTMYEILADNIIKSLDSNNINERIKDIEFLKQVMQNVKIERKYEVSSIQERADIITNLAEGLINKAEELKSEKLRNEAIEILNILLNEYKENASVILDYSKNGEMLVIAEMRHDTYIETVKRAKKLIEK